MTILAFEMVPLKRALKEVKTPFERLEKALEKGDCILIRGHLSYVVRVNQKTITVWQWAGGQIGGRKWESKYPKGDFQRLLLEGTRAQEIEVQGNKEWEQDKGT